MYKTQENSDRFAMGISMACIIHCFFAPSLIVMSYGFLSFSVDSEFVHLVLLLTTIPISLFALGLGYKNHKVLSYLLIGAVGLLVLTSAYLIEDVIAQPLERFITILGASIIALSHFKNYKKCKEIQCICHE